MGKEQNPTHRVQCEYLSDKFLRTSHLVQHHVLQLLGDQIQKPLMAMLRYLLLGHVFSCFSSVLM